MDTLGDDYILIPQDFGMIRFCIQIKHGIHNNESIPNRNGRKIQKNSPYNQLLKLTIWTICVRRMRLELTRRNRHYPLKVACLPIPPPAREKVPRTGLEPACLSTHAPETCASTNSATWAFLQYIKKAASYRVCYRLERKTGLEPATLTLARLCSTN